MKRYPAILLLFWAIVPASAPAAVKLSTLVTFNGTNGSTPYSGLAPGADGNFYGTTYAGGAAFPATNGGIIFRITPDGSFTMLHSFTYADGRSPQAGLEAGADDALYGTTAFGGPQNLGTTFKITTEGAFQSLFSFNGVNGAEPGADLVRAADGNFYGTTLRGGPSSGSGNGTVFKMTPGGAVTTLVNCVFSNGILPVAGLVEGSDGCLYGSAQNGGANGDFGTFFKITTNGVFTRLYSFSSASARWPQVSLTAAPDGFLYGVLPTSSGTYGLGCVFRLSIDGVFTTLVSFDGTNGAYPYGGLIVGSDGNLYGITTQGGAHNVGTIFRMSLDGSLTTLFSFNGVNGAKPMAALVEGADGNFYGTTKEGGDFFRGTVFRFAITPEPELRIDSGAAGTLSLAWDAIVGRTYRAQYSTDLAPADWTDLGPDIVATNFNTRLEGLTPSDGQRFYRVILLP